MRILLLHLSDIHFQGDARSNKVLEHIEHISGVVERGAADSLACFIVISGDIAFSGKPQEYEIALDFITKLTKSIGDSHPALKVHVVAVPGNHDCDFAQESEMRKFVFKSGGLRNAEDINEAVVKELTAIQDSFFRFESTMGNEPEDKGVSYSGLDRLYYERPFIVDGTYITFQCFNAAWMSQIPEPQGQMVYPLHLVKSGEKESDLVISVFHHPDRWLESNNSRPFREYVEQTSDVVMTGHEHSSDRFTKHNRLGAVSEYIEGGALQNPDNARASGFNLIELDLTSKKKKVISYELAKNSYKTDGRTEWKTFERNVSLRSKGFINNESFANWLIETGTPYSHRSQHALTLPDLFIFPDLDAVPLDKKQGEDELELEIPTERVVSFAIEHVLLLVTGADQAGKTSMAKMLYRELLDRGSVPVIVDGASIKSTNSDDLLKLVDRQVAAQYDNSVLARFEQLKPERKVLIIDDFDHTSIRSREGHNLIIDSLRRHYERIIIFVGDLFQLAELTQVSDEESAFNAFSHVEIKEFGHQLRNRLITKWVTFDRDFTVDETNLEHQIQEYAHKVSTLLLRKTVPAYPVIVLSMLQMFDLNQEVAADKGEFGYFYEAFIMQKMAKCKQPSIAMSTTDGYITERLIDCLLQRAVQWAWLILLILPNSTGGNTALAFLRKRC